MCGIYYLLLWGALNDCWCTTSTIESLWTSQETAAFFFFLLRLKKDSTLYLCTHIMSPSIAYSYAHTDRQTHAPAAEDEGQGRMGPQKDICKRMASPKQAQRLGCREREQESYQKWQLDWLWQGTDGIERLHQCRKPCHQQFCAFR